jgi:hypothetical protein
MCARLAMASQRKGPCAFGPEWLLVVVSAPTPRKASSE